MDRFESLLLAVWREACRHTDIRRVYRHHRADACALDAAGANPRAPIGSRTVGRGNNRHRSTRALRAGTSAHCHSGGQILAALGRVGHAEIEHRGRKKLAGNLALVVPQGTTGDVLAGPLSGPAGPAGVLVIVGRSKARFGDEHVQLAAALLEPFSVALENHLRLHELAALREAAEADRRSLLTRLGRRDLAETIVGASSGLRPVLERVELVAQSDVPVLILGETGTGKEVIARAIHMRSRRAAGPFIRINCGAIPPELIDSHLFGHERGSFTGALETRQGWFERADGGTLFLDEIGELPLAAQVRLLRVLQDGYVERVGGQNSIRVDVRIVAATHRDLSGMVKDGGFREDLWYRVAVFPVLLPPLRDRREDIAELARHFAEKAATRFGLMLVLPSPQDIRLLAAYSWPGNIRELATVIDRAAILGDGKSLEVAKAIGISPSSERLVPQSGENVPSAISAPTTVESLERAMARHIEAALRATRGRIEGPDGAAALLKINPHTLRARMRKHDIDWSRFRSPSVD